MLPGLQGLAQNGRRERPKVNGLPVSAQLAPLVVQGLKTATRRLSGLEAVNASPGDWAIIDECLEPDESWVEFCCPGKGAMHDLTCRPRYHVEQRLAMLTTWSTFNGWDSVKPSQLIGIDNFPFWHAGLDEKTGYATHGQFGKSRPGRFLPNHLRPLMPQIEITGVRCERLQNISTSDCLSEGIRDFSGDPDQEMPMPLELFSELWDSINPEIPWAFNPWVFCYSFRVLPKPEDPK